MKNLSSFVAMLAMCALALVSASAAFAESPPAPNIPPTLSPIGPKFADENTLITFQIFGADTDSQTLFYSAMNLPQGSWFDSGTRTFYWTPAYGQAGNYIVGFRVGDGNSYADQNAQITVAHAHRPPLAKDDSASTSQGKSVHVKPLENDSNFDGRAISIEYAEAPSHGSAVVDGNTITYTPDPSYYGVDSSYTT